MIVPQYSITGVCHTGQVENYLIMVGLFVSKVFLLDGANSPSNVYLISSRIDNSPESL